MTMVGFGASQALRLGGNLVLAKLLFPGAFGVVGLAGVFLSGLQMFSDIGIGPSIIQNKRGEDRAFLDTAWTIQVIRGTLLWLVTCAIAWPISELYDKQLLYVLPITGLVALISGFNSTAGFGAYRRLALARIVGLDLFCQLVSVVVMITWAFFDRTVWALVAGGLTAAMIRAVLSHIIFEGGPDRFRLEPQAVRELLHFGRWIFISTVVTFLSLQADRLLLGVLVPIAVVGVYTLAMSVARLPIEVATRLSGDVLFPVLSRAAHGDRSVLERHFTRARGAILAAMLAVSAAMAIGAPLFFRLLYDARYEDAAWIAPMLVLAFWFEILHVSADRLLLAIGNSKALALSNGVRAVAMAGGCLLGYHVGGRPGFLAGGCLGSLAGHVVVPWTLARDGFGIVKADAVLTGVLVAAWALSEGLGQAFRPIGRTTGDLAAAVLVIGAVTLLAGFRAKKLVAKA